MADSLIAPARSAGEFIGLSADDEDDRCELALRARNARLRTR